MGFCHSFGAVLSGKWTFSHKRESAVLFCLTGLHLFMKREVKCPPSSRGQTLLSSQTSGGGEVWLTRFNGPWRGRRFSQNPSECLFPFTAPHRMIRTWNIYPWLYFKNTAICQWALSLLEVPHQYWPAGTLAAVIYGLWLWRGLWEWAEGCLGKSVNSVSQKSSWSLRPLPQDHGSAHRSAAPVTCSSCHTEKHMEFLPFNVIFLDIWAGIPLCHAGKWLKYLCVCVCACVQLE